MKGRGDLSDRDAGGCHRARPFGETADRVAARFVHVELRHQRGIKRIFADHKRGGKQQQVTADGKRNAFGQRRLGQGAQGRRHLRPRRQWFA